MDACNEGEIEARRWNVVVIIHRTAREGLVERSAIPPLAPRVQDSVWAATLGDSIWPTNPATDRVPRQPVFYVKSVIDPRLHPS